ncbi:HAD-IIIC family phosphatase [Microbulbifer sp. ZKSA006]|uniref:HAD-IIIC family phosphatase n=1 Tax=Microbulbifer sp. ZKSA006 TaxID=3243390 RepID=UPI004039F0E3
MLENKSKPIKCVVWDLDHTLWQGVLLESDRVDLKPGITRVIKVLDSRGILQSIASKNDFTLARSRLKALGLWEYFLYPQISFNTKSSALQQIASDLNIGLDTLAFVDDQPFERKEVQFEHPQVTVIDAVHSLSILDWPIMQPQFLTGESIARRQLYKNDEKRRYAERAFIGPSEAFLASLNMVFEIYPATTRDLERTEELIQRTHQLNTTGYTYSVEQLKTFCQSDNHLVLVAKLSDDFGSYGTIGFALVELREACWIIKLLLMSCRVMSRGVGTIMLHSIVNEARKESVRLQAEFICNGRNRQMYVTYKFGGFREVSQLGAVLLLEHEFKYIQSLPDYVEVRFQCH